MKLILIILLLFFSAKVFAVEPCTIVPEGKQRRDGVCSYEDAAFRARHVFSYILSLKKYCDSATQEKIKKWHQRNTLLIENALIIGKQPLQAIINNTDVTLWQLESRERINASCADVKRKIHTSSPSLFGGRVGEYLSSYAPNKPFNQDH